LASQAKRENISEARSASEDALLPQTSETPKQVAITDDTVVVHPLPRDVPTLDTLAINAIVPALDHMVISSSHSASERAESADLVSTA
jgi:hypothetical protein